MNERYTQCHLREYQCSGNHFQSLWYPLTFESECCDILQQVSELLPRLYRKHVDSRARSLLREVQKSEGLSRYIQHGEFRLAYRLPEALLSRPAIRDLIKIVTVFRTLAIKLGKLKYSLCRLRMMRVARKRSALARLSRTGLYSSCALAVASFS
jgi:hypothetical protein